jgi:hypothetical protein
MYPGERPEGWGFPPYEAIYAHPVVPWIHVTGRLLWLHRTEADRNQPLVTATAPGLGPTVLSMDHLNFPTEGGVRGAITFGPWRDRFLELAYSGVFDQEARASVSLDPATTGVVDMSRLFFGTVTTSVTNFDATAVYESDFHSPEVNLWLGETPWRFRPMLGVRWIAQSEDFQVFDTANPANGGFAEMTNDLVGGQIGLQTILWQRAQWVRVQAIGKAGLYHNRMDLRAALNDGGATIASFDQTSSATSCCLDLGVTAIWQLTPHLNFHVGYTGLWLTEVGMVGDQNDNFDVLTGTGTLDLGTISYQGGHLGFTLTW